MKARVLSPRQIMAARLLVHGATAAHAARSLGISVRTIMRWKKERRFRNEVRKQTDAIRLKRISVPPPPPRRVLPPYKVTSEDLRNMAQIMEMNERAEKRARRHPETEVSSSVTKCHAHTNVAIQTHGDLGNLIVERARNSAILASNPSPTKLQTARGGKNWRQNEAQMKRI